MQTFAFPMNMKSNLILFLLSFAFFFSSCLKKEEPFPLPPQGDAQNQLIDIGNNYMTQVFYSFTNGIVKSNQYDIWDVSFDVDPEVNELWMNGGKNVLIYPSGQNDFSYQLPTGVNSSQWLYDHPSFEAGNSGLGFLNPENHLGELLFVRIGSKDFKIQVLEANASFYKIKVGSKTDVEGEEVILNKDQDYNYVYYSFKDGVVQPEPVKTDWDMVFTRYRTVFAGLNTDGGDLPYLVNGILINTYNTLGASDSTRDFNFNDFGLKEAQTFDLNNRRESIGYNWKLVNINTAEYTILPKRMLLLKDQQQQLWKFHFVSFYDENGQRGKPQFEYIRLE